ncbi:HK3 isoform 5, partial [Pongo abelii]
LQQFKVTRAQLQQIQASLLGSMEQALRGQASPAPAVRMLPTYVGSTPHGTDFAGLRNLGSGQRALVLPATCLSVTCLPSRARRLCGAGAGGHRGLTACFVGDSNWH